MLRRWLETRSCKLIARRLESYLFVMWFFAQVCTRDGIPTCLYGNLERDLVDIFYLPYLATIGIIGVNGEAPPALPTLRGTRSHGMCAYGCGCGVLNGS
mmetsp:Transcript_3856/g.5747  ORF Transcript_3856/g.5747 Transcript_3856/m.5747 type:complete len:99 (+) Transcript_3856:589-885(+)